MHSLKQKKCILNFKEQELLLEIKKMKAASAIKSETAFLD